MSARIRFGTVTRYGKCVACGRKEGHASECPLHHDTLHKQDAAARTLLMRSHPGWSEVEKPRRVSHGPDPFRWVHPAWPADLKRWMLATLAKGNRPVRCRVRDGDGVVPLSFFDGIGAS